jgi:hypothetical protein
MSVSLAKLYEDGVDAEFRYSENILKLLEMVVVLVRPRAPLNMNTLTTPVPGTTPGSEGSGAKSSADGQRRMMEMQVVHIFIYCCCH